MGIFDSIFGGGQSKAYGDLARYIQQGMDARKQYTDKAIGFEQPYMDAGQHALGQYQDFMDKMHGDVENPTSWMDHYQESPYAKYLTDHGLTASNQAAASSGMLGSGANREDDMKLAQQIASGDMQNYFNNMMSQRNSYQNALSNLTGMGQNAATTSGGWDYGTGAGLDEDYNNLGKAYANQDKAKALGLNNMIGTIAHGFGYRPRGGFGGAGGFGGFGGFGF